MSDMSNLLAGKRIFLVEDDVVNIRVLTKPLSACGALIDFNWDGIGIEAHIIGHLPIDLIILDIMLRRGISGYDIFECLKRNSKTANIPVVAVTSLDPESEIPKTKLLGFSGYISKPINARTFAQDIADIIAGQKKWVVSR